METHRKLSTRLLCRMKMWNGLLKSEALCRWNVSQNEWNAFEYVAAIRRGYDDVLVALEESHEILHWHEHIDYLLDRWSFHHLFMWWKDKLAPSFIHHHNRIHHHHQKYMHEQVWQWLSQYCFLKNRQICNSGILLHNDLASSTECISERFRTPRAVAFIALDYGLAAGAAGAGAARKAGRPLLPVEAPKRETELSPLKLPPKTPLRIVAMSATDTSGVSAPANNQCQSVHIDRYGSRYSPPLVSSAWCLHRPTHRPTNYTQSLQFSF